MGKLSHKHKKNRGERHRRRQAAKMGLHLLNQRKGYVHDNRLSIHAWAVTIQF